MICDFRSFHGKILEVIILVLFKEANSSPLKILFPREDLILTGAMVIQFQADSAGESPFSVNYN